MRRVAHFVIVTLVLSLFGVPACSVMDGEDRDSLVDQISSLPVSELAALKLWAARKAVASFFKSKGDGQKIGEVECINGTWGANGIQEVPGAEFKYLKDITVKDVIECLEDGAMSYPDCVETIVEKLGFGLTMEAQKFIPGRFVECREVYSVNYHPDRVAADVAGLNEVKGGEMNRIAELMTVDAIIDALVLSKTPPPLPGGFAAGGALVRLLPFLCALADGWACPDDPQYPAPAGDKP